jgi:RNA recognition motif-containing protein
MKLFVGNLGFEVQDDDLRTAFEPFGQVDSASIIRDRMSSQSRGFGFVEMPSRHDALKAIDEMNGKEFMGRSMNVNEARPMPERAPMMRGGFSNPDKPRRGRDGERRRAAALKGRKQRFSRRPH